MRRALLFLSLCIGCIFGIGIADSIGVVVAVVIAGFIIITTFFLPRYQIVVFLFCLGLLLGSFRFVVFSQSDNYILNTDEITIQGVIIGEVEQKINKQRIVLAVDNLIEDEVVNVLVTLPLYPQYDFGDYLSLTGKLKLPEDFTYRDEYNRQVLFAYSDYLRLKKIDFVMYYPRNKKLLGTSNQMFIKQKLFLGKKLVTAQLHKILPEPHATFVSAILWGSRNALDPDVKKNFQKAGLSHIVALSGFNISIISLALLTLMPYLFIPRKFSVWLTVLIIFMFVIFTGGESSIVRAALMGSGSVIAYQLGRRARAFILLIVSVTLMILVDPLILLHDIGFQLSFLATLGLLLFSNYFENWLEFLPEFFGLRETVSVTLAATLATLPILILYFGRISLTSVLANIAIVPVVPFLMLVSFIGLVVSFFSSFFASGFILFTYLTSSYIVIVSKFLANLEFSEIPVPFVPVWVIGIIYFIFGVMIIFVNRKILNKLTRYIV